MPLLRHPAVVETANDLLPEARRLLDDETAKLGQAVSCRPRCSTCCNHEVWITAAEHRDVEHAIDALPDAVQDRIRTRARAISERLQDAGAADWPTQDHAMRYFGLGEPCPLLIDDACAVRDVRPLVCRNYIVSSDPAECTDPGSEQFVRIRRRYPVVRGFDAITEVFGETKTSLIDALLTSAPAPITERHSGGALAEHLVRG